MNTIESKIASLTNSFRVLVLRIGVGETVVIAAAVFFLLMRFWRLDLSPPGFHTDEMVAGANPVCLRHTRVDLWGNSWGLSSGGPLNNYGFTMGTPLHANIVFVIWFSIMGDSIIATRALEVMISLVIVACTVGMAYNLAGRRAATWVLALSAVSPWMWSLSRVAFLHPEFMNMHLFIGAWLLSRHIRRGDDPTTKELVAAGLLLGVSLMERYSIFATALIVLGFSLHFAIARRLLRPLGVLIGCTAASFTLMQITVGKYFRTRLGQMEISEQLASESTLIGKAFLVIRVTWGRLLEHLSFDFLVFNGDRNLRHHSGWGGMLSWPQVLLIALLPVALIVFGKAATHKREMRLIIVACIGALGGLLPAAVAAGGTPHANRSLVAAPFFVLGCAAVGATLTTSMKHLPAVCVVLGGLFAGYFLHDYFTEFPKRAEGNFQTEVRRAGEQAQATGDFAGFYAKLPQFMNMYGILSDRGLVFFEAAGSGRGCPGYGN